MLKNWRVFIHRFWAIRTVPCSNLHSTGGNLVKYVYISESNDIFVNLAFEDWLYQNYDFSKQQILLLWRNEPTVVIGRHQNPWLETNIECVKNSNIQIARRNSGGGAVYHDLENLNLSFFTSKESYNRKYNLEIIVDTLKNEWGINCVINNREDITYDDKKISGTASKLSRTGTYHHCTLLVDCNTNLMSTLLGAKNKKIVTNATRSIPSAVVNLRELNYSINVQRLITVIAIKYLCTSSFSKSNSIDLIHTSKGFQFISPEEKYFPGLNEKIAQFRSWDWIFGRTPKFKTEFSLNVFESPSCSDTVNVCVEVEHAIIQSVEVHVPPSFLVFITSDSMRHVVASFRHQKYTIELIAQMQETIFNYFKNKLEDPRLNSVLR